MVFISYSSADREAAEAVSAALESRSVFCWVALRNIRVGQEWGAAIMSGIEASQAMVVVFSKDAAVSPQVRRELAHAARRDLSIAILRLDDTEPSQPLSIFAAEFAEADPGSVALEDRITRLAERVAGLKRKAQLPDLPPRATLAKVKLEAPLGPLQQALKGVWVTS